VDTDVLSVVVIIGPKNIDCPEQRSVVTTSVMTTLRDFATVFMHRIYGAS